MLLRTFIVVFISLFSSLTACSVLGDDYRDSYVGKMWVAPQGEGPYVPWLRFTKNDGSPSLFLQASRDNAMDIEGSDGCGGLDGVVVVSDGVIVEGEVGVTANFCSWPPSGVETPAGDGRLEVIDGVLTVAVDRNGVVSSSQYVPFGSLPAVTLDEMVGDYGDVTVTEDAVIHDGCEIPYTTADNGAVKFGEHKCPSSVPEWERFALVDEGFLAASNDKVVKLTVDN